MVGSSATHIPSDEQDAHTLETLHRFESALSTTVCSGFPDHQKHLLVAHPKAETSAEMPGHGIPLWYTIVLESRDATGRRAIMRESQAK